MYIYIAYSPVYMCMCPGLCVCVCCGAAQCRSSFMRVNGIVYWLTVNVLPPTSPSQKWVWRSLLQLLLPATCDVMRCDAASSVGRDGLHCSPMRWALPIFSKFSHYPAKPAFCAHISGFFLHFLFPEYPIQHHYLYRLPIPTAPQAVRAIENLPLCYGK